MTTFVGQTAQTDPEWFSDGPHQYTILSESDISAHLAALASPTTINGTRCISFQPCQIPGKNEDRYAIQEWHLPGGTWRFWGLFDGHAGPNTVNYTVITLPIQLKTAVLESLQRERVAVLPEHVVLELLRSTASRFDDEIANDFLSLVPGRMEDVLMMSDEEIRAKCTEGEGFGTRAKPEVLHCTDGCTMLVALLDPARNLYIASMGDCQAVLGIKQSSGMWHASVLSAYHNGLNPVEVERIQNEHPNENECVKDGRVLGVIAVTRAIGDHCFKLPEAYSDRIFRVASPGSHIVTRLEAILPRHLTPPYVSNKADVQHVSLGDHDEEESWLIMCSDGLSDLFDCDDEASIEFAAKRWVEIVAGAQHDPALALLREGLGGGDVNMVSANITLERSWPWMDDTTVLVIPL